MYIVVATLQDKFPLRPVGKMTLDRNVDNWYAPISAAPFPLPFDVLPWQPNGPCSLLSMLLKGFSSGILSQPMRCCPPRLGCWQENSLRLPHAKSTTGGMHCFLSGPHFFVAEWTSVVWSCGHSPWTSNNHHPFCSFAMHLTMLGVTLIGLSCEYELADCHLLLSLGLSLQANLDVHNRGRVWQASRQ